MIVNEGRQVITTDEVDYLPSKDLFLSVVEGDGWGYRSRGRDDTKSVLLST